MSWEDIIKIAWDIDHESGIKYKKDPNDNGRIASMSSQELRNAAGFTPGDGTVSYDNSGFDHATSGHWAYSPFNNRWFCLTCGVEFKMPDDKEQEAQRQQKNETGEPEQTDPHGVGGYGVRSFRAYPDKY